MEHFSWRLIFVAQVPIALLGLFVAFILLPDTEREERAAFDLAGTVLLAAAVAGILLGLNRGPEVGWSSPIVIAGFALAPILLMAFVRVERRAADPLLPLRYLRSRNVGLPLVVEFTNNFAYMGGFILTPLLLEQVLGYGETRAGLLLDRPSARLLDLGAVGRLLRRSGGGAQGGHVRDAGDRLLDDRDVPGLTGRARTC